MKKLNIFNVLDFYDFINDKIIKIIGYNFISNILTSFIIGGLIPVILYFITKESGFGNLTNHGIILLLIWISLALFFIKTGYNKLNSFLEKLKQSKLIFDCIDSKCDNKINNIKKSFYSGKKYLKTLIIIFMISLPAFCSILLSFSGIKLVFFIFCYINGIVLSSFGLYFLFNSVNIITDIINEINTNNINKIELFHYDKMGGTKFLAYFSNLTTLLWFSGSMTIPFFIDTFKVFSNNIFIQYFLFGFIIILGIWSFVYPQIIIRNKSIEIKNELLKNANNLIINNFFKNEEKILNTSKEDREKIIFYNEYYIKIINNLEVWPFNVSGFLSFLGSISIPIIVSLITYFLQIK